MAREAKPSQPAKTQASNASPPTIATALAMIPGAPKWTDEQHAGITTTGFHVLVSAAAGSGKTAVLAERCAFLVCDAAEGVRCGVDDLLVVTFTEAAAGEMKSRIERALQARASQAHDAGVERSNYLTRQLAMVQRASIGTLHGFCARLLRQHFHLVGLDPNFTILDPEEARLMRLELAREVFANRYEGEDSSAFQSLVDRYADGYDERLIGEVVGAYEMLCSMADPAQWRATAIERIESAANGDFGQSELGKELKCLLQNRLAAIGRRAVEATKAIQAMDGFEKYVDLLKELTQTLRHWFAVLRDDGIDALAEVSRDLQLPRLPSVPAATPNKDVAKGLIDAVRNEITKGRLSEMLRFSETEWKDGLAATLPHAQLFLDLVTEFGQRYAAAKAEARTIDFADLERLSLEVLTDRDAGPSKSGELIPSAIARMYHRQFQHVLVDEYQDINEVQDAILRLISRECVTGQRGFTTPNLFCVGDVKQSIYRFRLADPTRFLKRHDLFKADGNATSKLVHLRQNFRSRAALLTAVNAVFKRLMTREAADIDYDESHELRAGMEYPTSTDKSCFAGSPIELHLMPAKLSLTTTGDDAAGQAATPTDSDTLEELELDRTLREARLVVDRLKCLMGMSPGSRRMNVVEKNKAGEFVQRALRWGDIAILLRAVHFKADQFAEVLREHGIPVHSEGRSGFFQTMEIRDILALLHLLDNQQQDIPLAAVLRSPIAGIPEPDDALARIALAFRGELEPVPFHRSAMRYATEKDDELAAMLRDFFAQLANWRELARQRPVAEVLWFIYDQIGYLAFVSGLADGEQRQANLVDLHERARQFGTFQRQGLSRFLQFLSALQSEADLGQAAVQSQADDVVRIMSIHKSKGLEFPVVVLPDLGKLINLSDTHGSILFDRHAYLGLSVVDETRRVRYPSLASTLVGARLRQQGLAEELRVLYVAMTRAKEHLILIGTASETAPQRWQSLFGAHQGPLPSDVILDGGSLLDWIGPAAAAMGNESAELIHITEHGAEEIAGWATVEEKGSTRADEIHAKLAQLQPLHPAPAMDDAAAQGVVARLESLGAHREFSRVPATWAVTQLSKGRGNSAIESTQEPEAIKGLNGPTALRGPRCVSGELPPTGAEIGTATHVLLQHLELSLLPTMETLKGERERLVDTKIFSPADATLADLEAIAWLLQTPLGQRMRSAGAKLRRELTVYYALRADSAATAPASEDPLDQIMVRGRLDALLETSDGLEIIDYKTDRVSDAALDERVQLYRGQLNLYRDALMLITGRPVHKMHLAFVHARQIIELS